MSPPPTKPDLTRLRQTELLALVNGTPMGAVLSRARLRRHLDAAAGRVGSGGRIHLLRYLRWLVLERHRPRRDAGPIDYAEARRRESLRQRAKTKAGQDIAPIPDVADWPRREATRQDLRLFCEKYFAAAFPWPWSPAHLTAIDILQTTITKGGLFAYAMFRGGGKTTLGRVASLWALLGDHAPFVCAIGASERQALRLLLAPVKTAILANDILLADFPEAVYPLRALENSSKRQLQQHVGGHLTHVRWEPDRVVFPTLAPQHLPPSFRQRGLERGAASGAVLSVTSLDANFRGQQHTRPDGTVIRPAFVYLDDPQTRESARSAFQTETRHELIHGDVLYLAGPGRMVSSVVLCTKIYKDDLTDRLLDPERSPDWQSQCTRFLISFPTDMELWAANAETRRTRGTAAAARHYRKHRKAMDAGAEVAWPACYDRRTQVSALQYAMDLYWRNPAAFWAEYQNEPQYEQLTEEVLTARDVLAKLNGRHRSTIPIEAPHLTAFIDVHDRLLFYTVVAWTDALTGYIVDYGTFPQQNRSWFEMRNATRILTKHYRGRSVDAAIHAGLEQLARQLLMTDWPRGPAGQGGSARINRLLVDIGYRPDIVAAVKHRLGGDTLQLYRGVGLGAKNRPISEYRRKPGERYGHHWYMPNVRATSEFPHVAADVNYWKTWLHRALAAPAGEPGNITLWGRQAKPHELLAEHIANSETWVETMGHGRTVHEWSPRPNRPDNHWLDCLVGCAVAASTLGCQTPAMKAGGQVQPGRKRYTQADLQRRSA